MLRELPPEICGDSNPSVAIDVLALQITDGGGLLDNAPLSLPTRRQKASSSAVDRSSRRHSPPIWVNCPVARGLAR